MLDMQPSSDAFALSDDADCKRLLQQILVSRHFKKSPRLRDFLSYICECALARRFDEISEQQIALHVFGRSTDYNAAEDTIVRTAARQLRQKLELYNLDEGANGDWRLTIPRGSYLPLFEKIGTPVEIVSSPADKIVSPRAVPRRLIISLGMLAACGALIWSGIAISDRMDPQAIFWRTILPSSQTTQLVSGDSALPILQDQTHRAVHVREYAAGKPVLPSDEVPQAGSADPRATFWRRRYTSVADLIMAAKTAVMAEKLGRKIELKYARDISLQDLKAGNTILIGGPAGNPWVELYSQQLNFDFEFDAIDGSIITNREPKGQEEAVYRVAPGSPTSKAYAVIALTTGLDGHSRALLLEGTSVAGTDAAVNFVFSSPNFPEALKSAIHGWSLDDFEMLIETENIVASGAQTKVVGVRTHRRQP